MKKFLVIGAVVTAGIVFALLGRESHPEIKPTDGGITYQKAPELPEKEKSFPFYPTKSLTPGDIDRSLNAEYLCSHSAKERRNVPLARKKLVYEQYGVEYPQPKGSYETDHFIPLSLGGTNSEDNLWPQSEGEEEFVGFREKDRLEFFTYKKMCSGDLTLDEARRLLWDDWAKAYSELIAFPRGNGNGVGAPLEDDFWKDYIQDDDGNP